MGLRRSHAIAKQNAARLHFALSAITELGLESLDTENIQLLLNSLARVTALLEQRMTSKDLTKTGSKT